MRPGQGDGLLEDRLGLVAAAGQRGQGRGAFGQQRALEQPLAVGADARELVVDVLQRQRLLPELPQDLGLQRGEPRLPVLEPGLRPALDAGLHLGQPFLPSVAGHAPSPSRARCGPSR